MGLNIEDTASLRDFNTAVFAPVSSEAECRFRIDRLQSLSRKGLWGIILFMVLSAVGYAVIGYQSVIPAEIFDRFGAAPPVSLISLALAVYCFSALILTLPRIVDGSDTYRGWAVVAYLGAFYGFYFYARALDVNFWAVFATGALLLTLEYISLLIHCRREIQLEKETIERCRRLQVQ